MSKTISQLAKEIGVSKSTVWHKTKNEQIASQLEEHSKTIGNTLYIDEEGEKIIKSIFEPFISNRQQNADNTHNKKTKKPDNPPSEANSSEINYTNKQVIDILNQQMEALHKQIEELRKDNRNLVSELNLERKNLFEIANKLAELANNAQKLHASDIVIPKIESKTEQNNSSKKNNIFSIFFKRKAKTNEQ